MGLQPFTLSDLCDEFVSFLHQWAAGARRPEFWEKGVRKNRQSVQKPVAFVTSCVRSARLPFVLVPTVPAWALSLCLKRRNK